MKSFNSSVRILLSGTLLLGNLSSCTPRETIRRSSQAADEMLFNQKNTGSQTWEASEAPDLRMPEIQKYVQSVLDNLSEGAKTPHLYKVRITDDFVVNGASLSNGRIIVTRGMLYACVNEAELAGYLGHEIGHKDLEHKGYERPKRGLVGEMVHKGIGLIPDSYGVARETEKHGEEIAHKHFNQKNEQAADEFGAELAGKAGYDPYALADLFDRLSGMVNKNVLYRVAKIKGTHKALDVRANHLRIFLRSKRVSKEGKLDADHYSEGLSSLIEVDDKKISERRSTALLRIEEEIQRYTNSNEPLPVDRYISLMRQLSVLRRDNAFPESASKHVYRSDKNASGFMEEIIRLTERIFGKSDNPLFMKRVDAAISAIGHLGIGLFPPGAFGAFGYEAITGSDFMFDTRISKEQRALSALMTLLAGTGLTSGYQAYKAAFAAPAVIQAIGAASATEGMASVERAFGIAKAPLRTTGAELNQLMMAHGKEPAWQELGAVKRFITADDIVLSQAGKSGQPGYWFANADIQTIGKARYVDQFAIPDGVEGVTVIREVKIPAGSTLEIGRAGPNIYGSGGPFQWHVTDGPPLQVLKETRWID